MASNSVVLTVLAAGLATGALIDLKTRRVPNLITITLAATGVACAAAGWSGLSVQSSLLGFALGFALMLPGHMLGATGAGDVKLLAGVGAWMGPALTLGAFAATAITGGLMAIAMVAWSGDYIRHWAMFQTIGHEIVTVRDPALLSEKAAARKPTMMLLPYGIPITVGSIAYFGYLGLFF